MHSRPHRPDVVVVGKEPLAELRIYDDMVLLTRRDSNGCWRSYPVHPDALAQCLGRVPVSLGLLPGGTIGAGRIDGDPFYVAYVAPRTARLQTPERMYTIPLPPLVWCGWGNDYRIWALAPERPNTINAGLPLYHAPFPNCYGDGRICWGNVGNIPWAAPSTVLKVLRLFLEDSQFNLHIAGGKSKAYPVSVVAQWAALEESGAESYPLGDLEPTGRTLETALSGRLWGGWR